MTVDMGDLALLGLAVMCLAVFARLLLGVVKGQAMGIDKLGQVLFVERLRAPVLTVAMRAISNLASAPFIIGVLLAAFTWAPCKRQVILGALNVGAVTAIDQLLKAIVRRPRPEGSRLVEAPGLGFPSGHSMAAMTFYGYGICLARSGVCLFPSSVVTVEALVCVILAVGVSRIYLGVHYASDVLGGFCLALAWLTLFVRLTVPFIAA